MTQRAIDGPYIYFVTTNTTFGQWLLDVSERAELLGRIVRETCKEHGFALYAYCILPNHIHTLVQKRKSTPLSKLMNDIKGRFSFALRMGRFWQPRFNFRIVDNEQYFIQVAEYIAHNYKKMNLDDRFGKFPFVFVDWQQIKNDR